MSLYKIEWRIRRSDHVSSWSNIYMSKEYKSIRRVLQAVNDMKKDPAWSECGIIEDNDYTKVFFDFKPVHYYKLKE